MAAEELHGTTLGEKHRQYNKRAKNALENSTELQDVEDLDVDNLIKIDVAAARRDVNYILKIFKCEDMLYVSRAIKQSKWLITDRQYAHIINPQYLHKEVFPHMMTKARSKLLLNIRLHLRDEDRVDNFYNYIKEQDENAALRWLPNCSLTVAEKAVLKHHVELNYTINRKLFKRLCEKSIKLLEICIKDCDYPGTNLRYTRFLIGNNTDKYLDFVETYARYQIPSFGPRSTSLLMKTCPHRILEKFEMYYRKIDLPTFCKHLKQEEIREIITKAAQNKEMESWFKYENIKHFVRYLPEEGRFDFLKTFFIDKSKDEVEKNTECKESCNAEGSDSIPLRSSVNIYRWYGFAPFEVAFPELTKLIRAESAPLERIAIFNVLWTCAGHNSQHIQTILQYYSDKHINEPYKIKYQFVNMVLKKTNTHKLNDTTWNILNNIFHSMEVYIESENSVQSCVEAIMVYKILRNENVPEIIESKFKFNSMKSIQYKLTDEEKEKVFKYLYKFLEKNIKNKQVNNENEFIDIVKMLEDVQSLFIDWNKTPLDYSWFLGKVEELIIIKNSSSWKVDLSTLYLKKNIWRRLMFKQSLILYPSDETCYNALKHNPELLSQNKSIVEGLLSNDKVSLQRVLRALRVYWPQTLAAAWLTWYHNRFTQLSSHKAITRGFCTLSPQRQVIAIAERYAPTDTKINWNEGDELLISLRKNLAQNMHLSRPLLPLEIVLLYAKGDHLQFILPSLITILHNLSAVRTRTHVIKLLDAPVSLQKHGIRFAFTKLESEEVKNIFHNIWNKTKNSTIRTVLFKQTYNLLCRQTKPAATQEIWKLMSLCIENLSTDENKGIYDILGKFDEVPKLVKGKFFMKSFTFLKTLPPHKLTNSTKDVQDLMYNMSGLIEHLDSEFVEGVLLETLDKSFTADRYQYSELMASYLLCTKDENSQSQRFQNLLLPLLERSFALGEEDFNVMHWVTKNVNTLLAELSKWFQKNVFERKLVFPTKLFFNIEDELIKRLPVEEFYETRTTWKLFATFVKCLEEHKEILVTIVTELTYYEIAKNLADPYYYYDPKKETKYNKMYMKAVPKFSAVCLDYLKNDVKEYFPSIYWMFAKCLESAFTNINQLVYLECLKLLLEDCDFIPSYVMVLNNIQRCDYYEDDEDDNEFGTSEKRKQEIREIIFSNPSAEIKFHYYVNYPRHESC